MLAIAACVVSCSKDEPVDPVVHRFRGVTEIYDSNVAPTRTSLDEGLNILWKRGDRVSIFDGATRNDAYQVTDASEGHTSAEFQLVSEGTVPGFQIGNNVAYYPYAADNTISLAGSLYSVNSTLPSSQPYVPDSFGNGYYPMMAVSASVSDTDLRFRNVLGALELQLKGTARIKSISVAGNSGEILCGPVTVSMSPVSGSVPSVAMNPEGGLTASLDCGQQGIQLDASTATGFIIVLPPVTFSSGFTVTITDTEGGMMTRSTAKVQTISRSKILRMPVFEYVGMNPFTITSMGDTDVMIAKHGSPDDISLEFRVNDGAWAAYVPGTSVSLTDGQCVQFQAGTSGNSRISSSMADYYNVVVGGSGTVAASGNIMSLKDATMQNNTLGANDFNNFFESCSNLSDASALVIPAVTAASECCRCMFHLCENLESAPVLSATTMAENCYHSMFSGCKKLVTAPALDATVLADYCYCNMFENCRSLVDAPVLVATELKKSCYYQMFANCILLETAPELPATTLVTTCYESMFSGCEKLCYVKAMFTTLPGSSYTQDWLCDVAQNGTFVKNKNATWDVRGSEGIPDYWTIETL